MYQLVTDATVLPLTLAEAKNALRLDSSVTTDDAFVYACIRAATEKCQDHTGLALITQTWKLYLDTFPGAPMEWWDGVRDGALMPCYADSIQITKAPIQSVTSIKTYDNSDVATTVSSSVYYVDTISKPARVVLRLGQIWPAVILRPANGVEITFVCGLGDTQNSVPHVLRQGMLNHIVAMYEHRGDMLGPDGSVLNVPSIPPSSIALYDQKRVIRL